MPPNEIATPTMERNIRHVVNQLHDLRATADASGADTLTKAAGLLLFLCGAVAGLESRLGRTPDETPHETP